MNILVKNGRLVELFSAVHASCEKIKDVYYFVFEDCFGRWICVGRFFSHYDVCRLLTILAETGTIDLSDYDTYDFMENYCDE